MLSPVNGDGDDAMLADLLRTLLEAALRAGLSGSALPFACRMNVSGVLWYIDPSVPVCSSSWSSAPSSIRSVSVLTGGRSPMTMPFAAPAFVARRRQYMYPRSRKSGLSMSSVAHLSTFCTSFWPWFGRWMKNLTEAVTRASWTCPKAVSRLQVNEG